MDDCFVVRGEIVALNINSYLSTTKYNSDVAAKTREELEAVEDVSAQSAVTVDSATPQDVSSEEEKQEIHEIHEIGEEKAPVPKITIRDAELSMSPAKPARSAGDLNGDRKETDISIQSLDMQQAISDMQKDRILHQYQFFVGSKDTTTV